mgnify:CR=1 FL=1
MCVQQRRHLRLGVHALHFGNIIAFRAQRAAAQQCGAGGVLPHSPEADVRLAQFVQIQRVQPGHATHQLKLDQTVDITLAQAVDVHHPAAGKMLNGLAALGATAEPAGAAGNRLAGFAPHMAAAHRAVVGQAVGRMQRFAVAVAEQVCAGQLAHGLADAMRHKPSRAVRAKAKHAVKL